jgi:hypothetical protein
MDSDDRRAGNPHTTSNRVGILPGTVRRMHTRAGPAGPVFARLRQQGQLKKNNVYSMKFIQIIVQPGPIPCGKYLSPDVNMVGKTTSQVNLS